MSGDARETGRTTEQMRAAPQGALYVWVNGALHYPAKLAGTLGRNDLTVVSPGSVDRAIAGTRRPVVLDHAARLPTDVRRRVEIHNALVEARR